MSMYRVFDELTFCRYGGHEAHQVRAAVQDVYEHSYVDAIASGDPFDSVPTFMHRFDAYASNPDLDLVLAYDRDTPVGQSWGWPLSAASRWWTGLRDIDDPSFGHETGTRTFALSEIMTCVGFTGRGVARALHDHLLGGRTEERATLLVEPDNDTAYGAYLHWGWEKVARLQPDWPDAPLFDVLILAPLPQRRP